MDKLTNIVRDEISRQYKSVRQFAFAVGIPLSTINSALHNGIGGSSFDTVVQICRTLGICALGEENIHLTEDTQRILDQYAKLDDYGRHTISSVMQVEYDRCTKTFEDSSELRGGYSSVNLSAPIANDEPVSMNVLASARTERITSFVGKQHKKRVFDRGRRLSFYTFPPKKRVIFGDFTEDYG